MSKEVDQRVVQMRFDNQQFERGVKTTLGTLDKLKSGLNLENSAKSLENLNSSVKKLDFNPLAAGVETVKNKFSALNVIGTTALVNITNSAVNAGKQLAKSLSTDQISAGWGKLAEETSSVQTIMNATGKSVEEVEGYLEKLMWFSDETSYGFTDMTAALGQLAASGADIEKMIPMITGIANATAFAGKGAGEFQRSIYNLTQSFGTGHLQLMDWKSLENAGTATATLKQTLIDTAVELGKINAGDVDVGNFSNTLKDGWADTEVMEKAFAKFSELSNAAYGAVKNGEYDTAAEAIEALSDKYSDLSVTSFKAAQESKSFADAVDATKDAVSTGWMKTFKTIFGNIEEQKVLWTELTNRLWDVFASGAETRNELLEEWKDLGGRDKLIEAFWNAWDGVASVITPIKDAFRDIFPRTTADQLINITENVRKFTEKMRLSDEQADNLKAAFKGLFSGIKLVADVIKAVVSGVFSLAKNFKDTGDTILKASAAVGEWFTNLHKSSEETNIFGKAVGTVVGVLQKAIDKIKEFFGIVKEKFDAVGFTTFLGVLKGIYGFAVKVGKVILDVGKKIGSTILGVFKVGGISGIIDILNGGLFGAFLININKLVNGVTGAFGGISDILENVTGILDGVKGALEAWQKSINAGTLLKIAKAVAILAASLFLIALIDGEKLGNALAGLSIIFMELAMTMSKFSKMEMALKGTGKLVTVMLGVSVSVLILATALKKLSSLSGEELAKGLVGVFALTTLVVAACKELDKTKGRAIKGAANIVIFASAIKILASACKDLSGLSWEELLKGLVGVGVLLAEVDIFLNTAKFSGKAFAACLGMIELAAAIKILASAAGDFAKMEWGEIAKGLGAIGGLLLELGLFVNLTGNAKHVFSTGLALVEIAAAMKIFASAVSDFAKMSWSEIGRGLSAMAGALTEVVAALKFMPKNVFGIGAGLVTVGAALNIISVALGKMGGMSWGEIAKGLAAMGGSMLILALGLNGMKKALGGAAALTVTAGALALLVPELKILGTMSIQQVGIALIALAGSFVVLGVAAKVLKPLTGTMIKVAGAIALFGVGCALAGAGILAVSIGLTALSASLVVAVASLGEIISGVCYSIANSSKAIAAAFAGLIEAACIALKGTIPLVADTLVTVLVESLTSLKTYLPQIVDLVMDIAVQLMDKLTIRVPELVTSAVNMVGRFMDAIDNALGAKGMKRLITSLKSVSIIFVAFAKTAEIISSLSVKDVLKGLPAFALAIAGFGVILAALGGISKIPGATEVINDGAKIFAAMGKAIGAFIGCLITGLVTNLPKDVSQTVAAMGTIVTIVLALAPVVEALSGIEANIKNVLKGMASVALVIAGITGVLAALGGLSNIPGFTELMDGGSMVLSGIGRALGLFVGSLIDGLAQAMTSDFEQVAKALVAVCSTMLAIGILTKIIKGTSPAAAAKGIAAFAVVVAGLTAVFAALGGLAQIPGFNWIIGEGGAVLCKIGSIIGEFIGSIVSGLGVGLTSGLPAMGQNLSDFMTSVTPFIEGARKINREMMDGVKALAEAILIITAADIVSGIASFLTGGSSIADFGEEIAEFGPCLKTFSDSVSGINNANVTAAANAAKSLAEMAHEVPNEGGLASWFAGENNVAKFGDDIASFGSSLKQFDSNVKGITPENVVAAADAAKSLAEMAHKVPNEGGLASWFAGENNVAKFGTDIASFGLSLKQFSDNIAGISPENVTAAANAAKSLAEMAHEVPNEGGMASWFAGENNVAKFGGDIASFGLSLRQFDTNVRGIVPENVTAAANAAKSLAEMADTIPNEGGIQSWFAGENSVSKFGEEIAVFGIHLKSFSDNVTGIVPENVTAAASAGKSLAEMANTIPNEGGIQSWFAGESSLSKFGEEIAGFGIDMKSFSDNVTGISPDNVMAAAEAGKNLAEMTSFIPTEGGVKAWFTGNSSLAKFGNEVASFGTDIKAFSDNVKDIKPENVAAAAEAGKNLAEMASVVPNEGGVKAWFTGDSSLAKFGNDIASFGVNIKNFSDNVKDIKPDNVAAAAEAGKALAELTQTIPEEGGIKAWFSGSQSLSKFGDQIADFGTCLQDFSDNVADLNVPAVEAASQAGKAFAEMTNYVPEDGSAFAIVTTIVGVGEAMKTFTETMDGVNADNGVAQVNKIVALAKSVKSADMSGLETITCSLKNVSDNGITKFINTFKNADTRAKTAIKDFVDKVVEHMKELRGDFGSVAGDYVAAFANVIKNSTQTVCKEFANIMESALNTVKGKIAEFQRSGHDAGKQFGEGFAEGIVENLEAVEKAAGGMGQAALDAARKTLDIHSPSKKAYSLGDYTGMAFVTALDDYRDKSYEAGAEMADSAKNGLADAISRISDIIDGNIECVPTVRPVLDLSNVKNGVSEMNGVLSANRSIDLAARTSFTADSAIESRTNGANKDVVNAVSALRDDVASLRDVVGNLKVVMDGGALVGQITDKMDDALGKKARLAGRR